MVAMPELPITEHKLVQAAAHKFAECVGRETKRECPSPSTMPWSFARAAIQRVWPHKLSLPHFIENTSWKRGLSQKRPVFTVTLFVLRRVYQKSRPDVIPMNFLPYVLIAGGGGLSCVSTQVQ